MGLEIGLRADPWLHARLYGGGFKMPRRRWRVAAGGGDVDSDRKHRQRRTE
jgi:hypothetical protein